MAPWQDPAWWAEHWTIIAGALGMLGAAYAAARRVGPKLRRIGHLVDDLAGESERPGVDARPGVMERLRHLDRVTDELRPNGGASMKDTLNRLDHRTERLDQRLAAVERLTIPDREDRS